MSKEDKGPLQETFFRLSKTGQSPWEIHRPQPMITHLVNQNIFHGNILDLGCGIGDNAVHIAKSSTNIRLTAIDFVCLVFNEEMTLEFLIGSKNTFNRSRESERRKCSD